MIRLLEAWSTKWWRIQLLQRLHDDPNFYESSTDPCAFLMALSSISDELDATGSILDCEFHVAVRVWFKRFATLSEGHKLPFIERLFAESRGVSLPLLVMEYLRDRNGSAFSKEARADRSIPEASAEQIEGLTELLLPEVQKRFIFRKFPVSPCEANRFYRLAHAIGPERLQQILVKDSELNGLEGAWSILKAVINGLGPQFGLDFFKLQSVGHPASDNVLRVMEGFASRQYWREFHQKASLTEPKETIELAILAHIEAGLEQLDEPPPASSEGT